ncbi:uncharacterized protein VTP21DRAFT_6737 [Calcarisporiella thermophila]|uniref:uncharacterized protein n=1 Tax=Calcarisporiella thermophila TaxID=911321 RepID=UPI003743B8F9
MILLLISASASVIKGGQNRQQWRSKQQLGQKQDRQDRLEDHDELIMTHNDGIHDGGQALNVVWRNDPPGTKAPNYQDFWFNDNTVIVRQSEQLSFEKPFIYMLFGEDKILLQDTGAANSEDPTFRQKIEQLIDEHCRRTGKPNSNLGLLVTHSHAHGDHTFNDPEFIGAPNTRIAGLSPNEVADFFGMASFEGEPTTFDLGNRPLLIFGIPGHEESSIAIYDPQTKWLLTGDSLYPGRLFVSDFVQYKQSIKRLANAVRQRNLQVDLIMGTHIEIDRNGNEFEEGAIFQPNEHPLELHLKNLFELEQALDSMKELQREVHKEFIIQPV